MQAEAIAKVKERQTQLFSYREPWCQRPVRPPADALDAAAQDCRARYTGPAPTATHSAPHRRLQARTNAAQPSRAEAQIALEPQIQQQQEHHHQQPQQQQQQGVAPATESIGTVHRYYMQGVYKPARLGSGLHVLSAQLENFLGPGLGGCIPDGLDPPMGDAQQASFLKRFHKVMQRMDLPTGPQQAVFAPVDIGVLSETCGNASRPKARAQGKHMRGERASRFPMDENADPNCA